MQKPSLILRLWHRYKSSNILQNSRAMILNLSRLWRETGEFENSQKINYSSQKYGITGDAVQVWDNRLTAMWIYEYIKWLALGNKNK